MKQLLQKTIEYGLIATLIVFPLSIAIALASPEDPGHPIISINFSIGDIVIGITFLLWALKVLIFKEWKSIKLPPTPILVFVAVGILSFLNSQALVQWLKEVIQMIEYMLIFYVLLLNNMQHIRIARLKNILFISTTILLLLSLIQHSFLDANVYLVRGLFENRNILGTFLCLVLPIVYIDLIYSPNLLRKRRTFPGNRSFDRKHSNQQKNRNKIWLVYFVAWHTLPVHIAFQEFSGAYRIC
jgi:hypothetical protein